MMASTANGTNKITIRDRPQHFSEQPLLSPVHQFRPNRRDKIPSHKRIAAFQSEFVRGESLRDPANISRTVLPVSEAYNCLLRQVE
jgi:hypothetical protein